MYTVTYERNWQIEPYVMEKYSLTMEFDEGVTTKLEAAEEVMVTVELMGLQSQRLREDRERYGIDIDHEAARSDQGAS